MLGRGFGYKEAPIITFPPPVYTGTQVEGAAQVENGRITAIAISTKGTGYAKETIITIPAQPVIGGLASYNLDMRSGNPRRFAYSAITYDYHKDVFYGGATDKAYAFVRNSTNTAWDS